MCEPRFDLIEKTVVAMVKKQHGENVELLGEWESLRDFAKYCWLKLERSIEYECYMDWQEIYKGLRNDGYFAINITAYKDVGRTSESEVCDIYYGFKIK